MNTTVPDGGVQRRLRRLAILILCLFVASGVARGQQSAAGQGTVTGQVIAQDTQLPARFAQVLLQSVVTATSSEGTNSWRGFAGSSSATTGADGTFTASNVAPGDYYVTASAPGYITVRSLLAAQVAAGANPADLLARIPVVHVGVGSVSSVTVTIERGGTVAGRVYWEDGSPASGLRITTLLNGAAPGSSAGVQSGATAADTLQQIGAGGGGSASTTTDDRGAFRLPGLASGDYLVMATVENRPQFGGRRQPGPSTSIIRVYSPGVFRKAAAKPITVRAGDERDDLRMVIDLRGLHTVAGHVTSITAGLNVASGSVSLADPSDNSLSLNGSVDARGEFTVQYVPPGNYTLSISGASTEPAPNVRERSNISATASSFQPFSEPIAVADTDLTGVTAAMTPVASAP